MNKHDLDTWKRMSDKLGWKPFWPKVITVTLPDPPPLKFVFADNGRFAIVIYEN